MARLPQPGGDQGQWGEILNDFLGQAHNSEGQLKTGSVTTPQLADGAVTVGKLSASSPSSGQALTYNGSDLEWAFAGGPAGPTGPTGATGPAGATGPTGAAGASTWGSITGTLSSQTDLQTALNSKANTSHTHASTDVTDFTESTQDIIGASIIAGTNVVVTYNDGAGTTTIDASAGSGNTDLGATYAVSTVTITSNTGADATVNAATTSNAGVLSSADKTKLDGIATGATANATDAQLRDRTTHTGAQAIATVTGLQAALDGKEPTVTTGTTGQYYRGDKSWQTLDKAAVGLANVDNTSDTNKPISTATQTALDGKAASSHVHAAGDTTSGTFATARLGSGTADGTTVLVGNQTWVKAPLLSINAQTGTTYTLVLGDAGSLVTLTNAGAITLTVPTNASVAFPVGTRVLLAQLGVGQVTVAGGGGVTVNADPGLKIAAQYGGAELIKLATDTWLLVGRLSV